MKSKNKFIICLHMGIFLAGALFAQSPVNFNFEGSTGAFFDNLSTGSVSVNGLTISASASSGTFNLTGNGFGINAAGSGDITDAFDAGEGAESMVFSFDSSGVFNFIDFDRVSSAGGDSLDLIFEGGPSFSLDSNSLDGADIFTFSQSFTSGQDITLLWTGGNGFGLEDINVSLSPIPEPSTYAVILGCFVMAVIGWKKHTRTGSKDQ